MSRARSVALLCLALGGAAGCSTLGEKVMERLREKPDATAPSKVDIHEAVVEPARPPPRDAGQIAARPAPQVHVPDDFPAAVPLYPNAKLKAATIADRDGKSAHLLLFETTDKSTEVADFYRAKLKGWKQTVDLTVGPTRRLELGSDKQALDVALSITQSADHAAVQLYATPRGAKGE